MGGRDIHQTELEIYRGSNCSLSVKAVSDACLIFLPSPLLMNA